MDNSIVTVDAVRSSRQQHRNHLEVIKNAVQSQGAVIVEAYYRMNQGEWTLSTGEVSANIDGNLIWKDASNQVMSWPPPGELGQIKGIFDAVVDTFNNAVNNTSRLAEEGIQSAVSHANQATDFLVNAASTTLSQQVNHLQHQQHELQQTQANHYAQYEAARNTIESERTNLAKWEAELEGQKKELIRKEGELKKASGDERARLQKEKDAAKAFIEKDKEALAREREELSELMAETEALLRESNAAKRDAEKRRIRALLNPTPQQSRNSSIAPSQQQQQQQTQRPNLTSFPSPPRRIPKPLQAPPPQQRYQHHNHITIDDDEDDDPDDEDDVRTCRSFATARSMEATNDFIAESDSFAMDPTAWKGRLSHITIDRTLRYLRETANVKANHWSEHILDDLLRILRGLMVTAMLAPDLLDGEAEDGSLKTILKRIFIFKETSIGHGGAYIKALSEAVDGSDRPAWILNAQRQARKDALASASATAPAKAPAKSGGKKAPGKGN